MPAGNAVADSSSTSRTSISRARSRASGSASRAPATASMNNDRYLNVGHAFMGRSTTRWPAPNGRQLLQSTLFDIRRVGRVGGSASSTAKVVSINDQIVTGLAACPSARPLPRQRGLRARPSACATGVLMGSSRRCVCRVVLATVPSRLFYDDPRPGRLRSPTGSISRSARRRASR